MSLLEYYQPAKCRAAAVIKILLLDSDAILRKLSFFKGGNIIIIRILFVGKKRIFGLFYILKFTLFSIKIVPTHTKKGTGKESGTLNLGCIKNLTFYNGIVQIAL